MKEIYLVCDRPENEAPNKEPSRTVYNYSFNGIFATGGGSMIFLKNKQILMY